VNAEPLSAVALAGIPEVRAGDDLAALLAAALPGDVGDGDIVAVAHKVVSKAEGRTRRLADIDPGERARALAAEHDKDARVVQAVLDESTALLRAGHGVLICETRHGLVCANAGVDRSNATDPDELILLPEDPDRSARALRAGIEALRGVRPAIVVSDSFGRAWRLGQTDVAIGTAGLTPLDDWRGRRDSRGRELHATAIAVADAIAGAADLARAKDADQPAVLLRGLGRFVTTNDGPGAVVLRRPPADDLFR
jgi:coenzyme F420-0:L-glutamate ligase/coenzyme F420-1:gamma-L-glutamate ligase